MSYLTEYGVFSKFDCAHCKFDLRCPEIAYFIFRLWRCPIAMRIIYTSCHTTVLYIPGSISPHFLRFERAA